LVIFDHRIAEKFVRGVIQGGTGGFDIRAFQLDFEVFANVDGFDAGMAHLGEGGLDGFALRIKDGFFRRDDDFGFHACAGKVCEKMAGQASEFFGQGVSGFETFSKTGKLKAWTTITQTILSDVRNCAAELW
jgi:hypothetical protein